MGSAGPSVPHRGPDMGASQPAVHAFNLKISHFDASVYEIAHSCARERDRSNSFDFAGLSKMFRLPRSRAICSGADVALNGSCQPFFTGRSPRVSDPFCASFFRSYPPTVLLVAFLGSCLAISRFRIVFQLFVAGVEADLSRLAHDWPGHWTPLPVVTTSIPAAAALRAVL